MLLEFIYCSRQKRGLPDFYVFFLELTFGRTHPLLLARVSSFPILSPAWPGFRFEVYSKPRFAHARYRTLMVVVSRLLFSGAPLSHVNAYPTLVLTSSCTQNTSVIYV